MPRMVNHDATTSRRRPGPSGGRQTPPPQPTGDHHHAPRPNCMVGGGAAAGGVTTNGASTCMTAAGGRAGPARSTCTSGGLRYGGWGLSGANGAAATASAAAAAARPQEQQQQQQQQQQKNQMVQNALERHKQHHCNNRSQEGPPSVVEFGGRMGGGADGSSGDGCYDTLEFTQLTQDSTFSLLGMDNDNSHEVGGSTSGRELGQDQEVVHVEAQKMRTQEDDDDDDDDSSATMAVNNNNQGHDKVKGSKEDEDEDEDEDLSIDLLAPSPPNKRSHQEMSNNSSDRRQEVMSAATPMTKGIKVGKKSAARPFSSTIEAPGSASSHSTAISPATQTLNALSQMDAVGGGDLMMMYGKSMDGNDDGGVTTDDEVTCNDDAVTVNSKKKSDNGNDNDNGEAKAISDKSKSAKKREAPASSALPPPSKETNGLTPTKKKKLATPKQTAKKGSGPAKASAKGTGWMSSTSAFAKGNSRTKSSVPAGDGKKKSQQATTTNSKKKGSKPQSGGATSRADFGTHIDLLITLSEKGKLGFRVKPTTGISQDIERMLSKIPDVDRPCVVEAIKEGSQADRAGLKAKDALFHVSQNKPECVGRYATVADAKEWAQQGAARPVIFMARRFNAKTRNGPALDLLGIGNSLVTNKKAIGATDTGPQSKSRAGDDEESRRPSSKPGSTEEDIGQIQSSPGGQIQSSPGSSKEEEQVYTFQGKTYKTYSDMVKAKRARNVEVLQDIGLIDISAAIRGGAVAQSKAKGGKKRKSKSNDEHLASKARRKSNRLEKNDKESDNSGDEGGLFPDCHACKKESVDDKSGGSSIGPLEHHSLCPERSDHVSSGARAHLKQIRRTLKRCDCPACKWYLKYRKEGAKNGRSHNPLCERSKLYNASAPGNAKVSTRRLVITFCKRCNREGGLDAPLDHHVFCPLHPNFERFGAKAKLERIQRNAIENGCEACCFRLENGRPDKSLTHGSRCDYNTEEKANERIGEDIVGIVDKSRASAPTSNSRESIIERLRRDGAKGHCKKCMESIRTGKKAAGSHHENCPLRNDQGLRRIGAASGCQKCVNELRTERKDKTAHSQICPLSKHYGTKVDLSLGADAGCQKCADELRTGTKQPKKGHSKTCPSSRYYKAKTNPADSSATTAAEILLDIRDSPHKMLSAKKTIDTESLSFHPISETSKEDTEATLLVNKSAHGVSNARITPSPKPQHASKEGMNSKAATAFPDTTEESDFEDKESSTLWEQCGNPWGDIGVSEEDHVIITPCSGLNPTEVAIASLALPTFNINPFDENSAYRQTHQRPEVGVRALKLKRDVMAMQPWGLGFKRHEFGGACLVTSVDSISPAAAAEDIGGGRNVRGVRVNDMVLMVNNKSVGGLTEDDLEVELETAGEQLTLVIAQYNGGPMKGQAHSDDANEEVAESWRELDEGAFDWQEVGPGSINVQQESLATRMPSAPCSTSGLTLDDSRGTAPDVSKLRRETFRTQASHDDHPLAANSHNETAASAGQTKGNASKPNIIGDFLSHPNDSATPKEKPEQQAKLENCDALSHSHIGVVGSGGIGEETRQKQGIGIDEDSYEVDTSLGGSQGRDGEDLTNDDSDSAPGLSLSRIMADFSLASQKKRKGEEGRNEDSTSKGSSLEKGTPSTTSTDIRARDVIADWNAEGGEGDDPELGCICGAIHEEPEPVFWLHCDTCESWYNNSVRCLGFDQEAAAKLEEWTCASCGGEPAVQLEGTEKISETDEDGEDLDDALPIGSRVNVAVGKDYWKGTVKRVGRKRGEVYYRVNLDGNRRATLSTVFSHQIHSLITEPEDEKQDEQTDRCDNPRMDAETGIKHPPTIAFGNNSVNEKERPSPKKWKESKRMPPANSFQAPERKASVGEEYSEDDFVITESEALFLSGNGINRVGNQHGVVRLKVRVGSEEQSMTCQMPLTTCSVGGLAWEGSNGNPNAEEQTKSLPPKKPVFETIEEIDEDIIEFKDCGKIERRRIDWDHMPISVGSLVRVADRSAGANGGNKLGGVAKVIGRRGCRSENNLIYDLHYVIGGHREFDVSWRYVVLNSAFSDGDGGGDGHGGSRRSRSSKKPTTLNM